MPTLKLVRTKIRTNRTLKQNCKKKKKKIDSIRVSLLGGRLLFKNLRYFSTNQSISILKGHIAVRYWLLHVRKSDGKKKKKKKFISYHKRAH